MIQYQFVVPGPPKAKGRPRHRLVKPESGKEFVSTYTPKKSANYENLVKTAYWQQHTGRPHDGPVAMYVVAYFPYPKSLRKAQRALAEQERLPLLTKPDYDNILKSVTDGLNEVAFKDDKLIYHAQIWCMYSPRPRTEIILQLYEEGEAVPCPSIRLLSGQQSESVESLGSPETVDSQPCLPL